MNKRREMITARQDKKKRKEIKKGMKIETVVAAKLPKASHIEIVKQEKQHKKTSKRTSPGEGIEGSTPAHLHRENERWGKCIESQTLLKASRLKRKLSKRTFHRARIG